MNAISMWERRWKGVIKLTTFLWLVKLITEMSTQVQLQGIGIPTYNKEIVRSVQISGEESHLFRWSIWFPNYIVVYRHQKLQFWGFWCRRLRICALLPGKHPTKIKQVNMLMNDIKEIIPPSWLRKHFFTNVDSVLHFS